MAIRGAGNQGNFWAPQSDPAVAATTGFMRMRGITATPDEENNSEAYRPPGQRAYSMVIPGDEWSTGDLGGRGIYDELYHALAMNYGAPATTTPAGGTLSRQHAWPVGESDIVDPKLYTLIIGDATYGERYAGVFGTGYNVEFTRQSVTFGGGVMGRKAETGFPAPATPTRAPLVPLVGKNTGVWLDAIGGTFGTTRMTRVVRTRYGVDTLNDAAFFLNETQDSYSEVVNGEAPGEGMSLWVAADSNFATLLAAARSGTRYKLRVSNIGPLIETTIKHKYTIDAVVQITKPDKRSSEQRMAGNVWNFIPVPDDTTGVQYTHTLVNTYVPV